jgi:tRNA pseudouridine38-40 synthase
LKLTLAYDGSRFAGSQMQPGQRTVQAELERALAVFAKGTVRATLAGRTDTGVHAAGQVASVRDIRPDLDLTSLHRALNAQLPDDLAVVEVERVENEFHARFDAAWREYRYRVWSGVPAPLVRHMVWHVGGRLNAQLLCGVADAFVGEHDFAAFAGGGEGVPWSDRQQAPRGTVRRVLAAQMAPLEPWWGGEPAGGALFEFRVAADAYLPRMVRNMVGALVEVGRGKRPESWIHELLDRRDRRFAGMTAPPQGLILWRVGYRDDVFSGC